MGQRGERSTGTGGGWRASLRTLLTFYPRQIPRYGGAIAWGLIATAAMLLAFPSVLRSLSGLGSGPYDGPINDVTTLSIVSISIATLVGLATLTVSAGAIVELTRQNLSGVEISLRRALARSIRRLPVAGVVVTLNVAVGAILVVAAPLVSVGAFVVLVLTPLVSLARHERRGRMFTIGVAAGGTTLLLASATFARGLLVPSVVLVVPSVAAMVTAHLWPRMPWPSARRSALVVVPLAGAIWWTIRSALALPSAIVDSGGPIGALRRSARITKPSPSWWSIALLVTLATGAWLVTELIVSALLAPLPGNDTAGAIGVLLVQLALAGLPLAALTVYYLEQPRTGVEPVADRPMPALRSPAVAVLTMAVLGASLAFSPLSSSKADALPDLTYVVNDRGDTSDSNPGDGSCSTGAGTCTLRAAMEEAASASGLDVGVTFAVDGTITVAAPIPVMGSVEISGSGRSVTVSGGGASRIFSLAGTESPLRIYDLTLADGRATDADGGGAILAYSGMIRLERVTLSSNRATVGGGGAVANHGASVTIVNSTFLDNAAAIAVGGADVYSSGGASITNSTFSGGDGHSLVNNGGLFVVDNSIVQPRTGFACEGVADGTSNLASDGSCPNSLPGDVGLGMPGNHGGVTVTVPVDPDGAAVDTADPALCPAEDQRGIPRPQGGGCDVGAYEVDPATTVTVSSAQPSAPVGIPIDLTATVDAPSEDVIATGTVTFTAVLVDPDAVDPPAPVELATVVVDAAGEARLTVADLSIGDYEITATYSGGGGLLPSTSTPITQNVTAGEVTARLSGPSSPSEVGVPVTFTASVSSAISTPTGTVTFTVDGTPVGDVDLDPSGTANFTTSDLDPGEREIGATYGGDAEHEPATADPLTHLVLRPVTVAVSTTPNTAQYGQPASVTVTVTSLYPGPVPTGNVHVTAQIDGSGVSIPLDAAGTGTATLPLLPVGAGDLIAAYDGDAAHSATASDLHRHTVVPATTVTALSVAPAGPTLALSPLTFTAQVTAPDSTVEPTGVVRFFVDGTAVGTAPVIAGTSALDQVRIPAGNHVITAALEPGTGFATSSAGPVSHEVRPAGATVALSADKTDTVRGEPVTFTADVTTETGGLATGVVIFRAGGSPLGSVTLDGAGRAALTISTLAVGLHSVTAEFSGDLSFGAAVSSPVDHMVERAATSVTIQASPSPGSSGASVSFTVEVDTVSPGSGSATGTVELVVDGASVGVATLDGAGRAQFSIVLGGGNHAIEARYGGDTDRLASIGRIQYGVDPVATSLSLTLSMDPVVRGAVTTFTAAIASSAGTAPTGTVQFSVDGVIIGSASVDGGGTASVSTSTVSVGSHLLVATYSGDDDYLATSGSLSFGVVQAATTLNLTAAPASVVAGEPVTLGALVTGSTGLIPTGTVTFTDHDTVIAVVAVDATGHAEFTVVPEVGDHAFAATYSGDVDHTASTSTASPVPVGPATTTTSLTATPPTVPFGGVVTLMARVSGGPGPTGTVTFSYAGGVLGVTALVDGVATLTAALPFGSHLVSAGYSGDTSHTASAASTVVVVEAVATTTAITAETYPVIAGRPATFTVSVRANTSDAPSPAGQVVFTIGDRTLDPVALDATGRASVTVGDLQRGTVIVQAVYVPTPGFMGSSATLNQVVGGQPVALNLTIDPHELVVGEAGKVTASFAGWFPQGGPIGPVLISSDDGMTCTIHDVTTGSCSMVWSTSGSHWLDAAYPGDPSFEAATRRLPVWVSQKDPRLAASTIPGPDAWMVGEPVSVRWTTQADDGLVQVWTPNGVACTVAARVGSCDVTFPSSADGIASWIRVMYLGSAAAHPAEVLLQGTPRGCHRLVVGATPANAGTVLVETAPNCGAGTGYLTATTVALRAVPAGPYHTLTGWSTGQGPVSTITVRAHAGMAPVRASFSVDCVPLTLGYTDIHGGSRTVDFWTDPRPNCGPSGLWFEWGTEVTVNATPRSESRNLVVGGSYHGASLFGWEGRPGVTGSSIKVVLTGPTSLVALVGRSCLAAPRLTAEGPGTVSVISPPNCRDVNGRAGWWEGTELRVRANPGPEGSFQGWRELGHNESEVSLKAGWAPHYPNLTARFISCVQLLTEVRGYGTVSRDNPGNCPNRGEGWYLPGTSVKIEAKPTIEATVEINAFLQWEGGGLDGRRADFAYLNLNRTTRVRAVFYDGRDCVSWKTSVVPVGAATVTAVDPGDCPDGMVPRSSAGHGVVATAVDPNALVAWKTNAPSNRPDFINNPGLGSASVQTEATELTAWVCARLDAELTIVGPRRSVTAPLPPTGSFMVAGPSPNCPAVDELAWTVGSVIELAPGAPSEAFRFVRWEGRVNTTVPEPKLPMTPGPDGGVPLRVVYEAICHRLTIHDPAHTQVSPKPNCPGADPEDGLYLNGTMVVLNALARDEHHWRGWTVDLSGTKTPALLQMNGDKAVGLDFEEYSWDEKANDFFEDVGDNLAVLAKKATGVLAVAVGDYIFSTILGKAELVINFGLPGITYLAKGFDFLLGELGVDTDIGGALEENMLNYVQQTMTYLESGFTCAGAWAAGTGNTDSVLATLGKATAKGVEAKEQQSKYEAGKISKNSLRKSQAKGAANVVATGLYNMLSSGPGVVWEDSAHDAWTGGGDIFVDCFKDSVPDYLGLDKTK